MHANRLRKLRQYMAENSLDGFVVSKKENIYYLSGTNTIHPTNREALLLVTPTKAVLYHSSFLTPYRLDFLTTVPMSQNGYREVLESTLFFAQRVGIESQNLTVAELERLKTLLPKPQYVPTQNTIESARITKDKEEISRIKKACEISSNGMKWIHNFISKNKHKNLSEIEVAKKLEDKFYQLGGQDLAYPTIIAFDAHSALPHHQPTTATLTPNSIVLIDAGCKYMGYCSDMTRTFKLGTKSAEFAKVATVVKAAYRKAIRTLAQSFTVTELTKNHHRGDEIDHHGGELILTAATVDSVTRDFITHKGYGDKFIHSTGHGLGLEIHEQPSVHISNPLALLPQTTLTIEPGVYLDTQFGYRYENTVLLT